MLPETLAGPAVLLKAYPVEVIRGNYLLGRRLARTGEAVKLDSMDGPKAKVFTLDGDVLTVYAADLRFLPDDAPLITAKAQPAATPQPTAAPSPTPAPVPPTPLIPDIFGSPTPAVVPTADKPAAADKVGKVTQAEKSAGEHRAEAVQCSGLTKKGTRCTRMTKSPNGMCWQHGGD